MKTPRILIPGAFGLILSISMTSCSTHRSSADSADTATAPPAPAPARAVVPMSAEIPTSVSATPVSLVQFYNVQGIVPDSTQFSASLDGDGYDCSSNLLGSSVSWKRVPFQLGTANKGANVVTCSGQVIPLPAGKFSTLEVLAIAVNGAQESQNFAINYGNSSLNQTFSQSLSDWAQPDSYSGETAALDMEYRDQSDGTRDDNSFYLFEYTFNLNPDATATSLVLPSNDNVKVFAVTLVQ
jgi:hypothetical protein